MGENTGENGGHVNIKPLDKNNVEEVMNINSVVLPVVYQQPVYNQMVAAGQSFVSYYKNEAVGAIGCRIERIKFEENQNIALPDPPADQQLVSGKEPLRVYIMTLAVLAPYRRLGIGRCLLKKMLNSVKEFEQEEGGVKVYQIYLHVQKTNIEALKFYESLGFANKKLIKDFYRRMDDRDCCLLVLDL